MNYFLSGDWGTSSFRIRLVEAGGTNVIAERKTQEGILVMHNKWIDSGQDEDRRMEFYLAYLQEQIRELENETGINLRNCRLILSGMSSSTIGMVVLPYKNVPFKSDGSDLHVEVFAENNLLVVSGVCTHNDVIRGEETILIGCHQPGSASSCLYILPGTHSKHIWVNNDQVSDFTTFMTGEIFGLLSKHSILRNSIQESPINNEDSAHFAEGVHAGMKGNILHEVFIVRTRQLLQGMDAVANFEYLSGLVIGTELKSISENKPDEIVLVADENQEKRYLPALRLALPAKKISVANADQSLIRGHGIIYDRFLHA